MIQIGFCYAEKNFIAGTSLLFIARKIVDAAYTVHAKLGPGLLEKVYKVCFCHELTKRGLRYRRQVELPIVYAGLTFDEGLSAFGGDVLVEKLIISELKAVDKMYPVWEAQILSHLKLTKKCLGFLINFIVPLIKKGIYRIIPQIFCGFVAE